MSNIFYIYEAIFGYEKHKFFNSITNIVYEASTTFRMSHFFNMKRTSLYNFSLILPIFIYFSGKRKALSTNCYGKIVLLFKLPYVRVLSSGKESDQCALRVCAQKAKYNEFFSHKVGVKVYYVIY